MFISIMMWPWCHTSTEHARDVCGLVVWVNAILVFTSSWMCFCPTVSLKMEYRYKRVCECKCRWVGGYAYVGGWLGVCVCVWESESLWMMVRTREWYMNVNYMISELSRCCVPACCLEVAWFPMIASKWHLSVLLQQLFMSFQSGITMLVLLTCVMQ